MKYLIVTLLSLSLISCSKNIGENAPKKVCYVCKWGPDTNGYVRPDFNLCTDQDWMKMHLFYDDRQNYIGGHCDKN
jgi:hypothetical protein